MHDSKPLTTTTLFPCPSSLPPSLPRPFIPILIISSRTTRHATRLDTTRLDSTQVTYDSDGGCYELLTFGSMDNASNGVGADPNELRRGSCLAAVFLARNRFAVLDKNRQVSLGIGGMFMRVWGWVGFACLFLRVCACVCLGTGV